MAELIREKIKILKQLGCHLRPSEVSYLKTAKNEVQLDNIARTIINKH